MTSFVGVSSSSRAQLTLWAKAMQGTITITLHRAQHLKHVTLEGAPSDPYCTLTLGSTSYQSTVCREGGQHPDWSLGSGAIRPKEKVPPTFKFYIGTQRPGFDQPHANEDHDGAIHIRVKDASRGPEEIIGRLDINLIQLLAPSSTDGLTGERWYPLGGARAIDVEQGFLCITATFDGSGLEEGLAGIEQINRMQQQQQQQHQQHTNQTNNTDKDAAIAMADGEHAIPQLVDPPSDVSELGATVSPVSRPSTANSVSLSSPLSPSSISRVGPHAHYPLPCPKPVAPGYPILPPEEMARPVTAAGGARPTTARPGTAATNATRPDTANGGERNDDGNLSDTTSSLRPASGDAADAAGAVDAELDIDLSLTLVTAFDIRHSHILQLVPQVPLGRFLCAGCAGEGYAHAYICTSGCEFTLHQLCIEERTTEEVEEEAAAAAAQAAQADEPSDQPAPFLPDMRLDGRHSHPLVWYDLAPSVDGDYQCVGCGGGGSGPVWHCNACKTSWDLHPACMR